MRSLRTWAACVFITAVFVGASSASAAPVDFNLDPARSTFRLGGTFNGADLVAQTVGSDVTGYTGTLHVDVDRAAGTLSFSTLPPRALDQPADQQPFTDFNQHANYGLATAGPSPALLAARSMDLNVGATNASFNAGAPALDQVTFYINGGTLYYSTAAVPIASADLHGGGGTDRVAGPLTLTREGDVETLTVPIRTVFAPYTGDGGDIINFTIAGQLVATRAVPEPGAAAAGLCCVALALVRRRR